MVREKPKYFGTNRAVVSVSSDSYFIFSLVGDLGRMLIKVLTHFFHRNNISNLFSTSSFVPFERIYIGSEFALEERRLPQVVVIVQNPVERMMSFKQLEDEFVGEDEDRYIRFGGVFDVDVELRIRTGDPSSRDTIGDILLLGLVYPVRNYLSHRRVVVHPNTVRAFNRGTSTLVEMGTEKKVYALTLSFRVQVEWAHDFKYHSYDLKTIALSPQKDTT